MPTYLFAILLLAAPGFATYRLALPPDLPPAPLSIEIGSDTWSPGGAAASGDARRLGILVDRLQLE